MRINTKHDLCGSSFRMPLTFLQGAYCKSYFSSRPHHIRWEMQALLTTLGTGLNFLGKPVTRGNCPQKLLKRHFCFTLYLSYWSTWKQVQNKVSWDRLLAFPEVNSLDNTLSQYSHSNYKICYLRKTRHLQSTTQAGELTKPSNKLDFYCHMIDCTGV